MSLNFQMLKVEVRQNISFSRNTLFASWYMPDKLSVKGKNETKDMIIGYFNSTDNDWIFPSGNNLIGRRTCFGIIGFSAIKDWLAGKGINVGNFSEIENDIAFITSFITNNVNEGILNELTKHASFVRLPDGNMQTLNMFEGSYDGINLPNEIKSMSSTERSKIGVATTDAAFLEDLIGQGIIISWTSRFLVNDYEVFKDDGITTPSIT